MWRHHSIIPLQDTVTEGFRNNKATIAISLDIDKAFDRCWPIIIILDNLVKWNIRGRMLKIIASMFQNRKIKVKCNNLHSEEYYLINGIDQGSPLSGTFFNIATSGIFSVVSPEVTLSSYIHDFLIYMSDKESKRLETILQNTLNGISSWCNTNGFILSKEKTTAIQFGRKKQNNIVNIYLS